jgi:heme A synthase
MTALRSIFKWWVAILFFGVLLQIAFAGYGAFYAADKVDGGTIDEDTFSDGFGLHTGFGYIIFLGALLLVILALLARPGKRRVWHSVAILGLVILQVLLAWFGYGVPAVFGALHPLNAFVIVGAVGSLAAMEWKKGRMGMGDRAAPAPPPAA